jgi:DNA-binding CsgD family transcriptional regulator
MAATSGLVGREQECTALDRMLADARAGTSSVLVVHGPPGVGKSAVLAYAAGHAGPLRVLRAIGIEAESGLPFAGLHQLLRPVLGLADRLPAPQAAALRGALGLAGPAGDRFLIGVGVLSLLGEAAEPEGLLAVVDDAQWLDAESAGALLFAARRLQCEGIVLLLACRDTGTPAFAAAGLPHLSLPGLPAAAAAALLASAGPQMAPGAADALITRTGGNPLALLELPRALTGRQRAGRDPLPDPLPVSDRVQDAFTGEVSRLPGGAQTILLVAAAEPTADLSLVLRAADGLGASAALLDDAERAGLVQVEGPTIGFRHPLIRSAVYGSATYSRRRAAHLALAEAVGAGQPDRRAWHQAAVADGPDPELAADLESSAGRAAQRGGHAAAAAALQRAADLTPGPADRARRLAAAADEAWQAGRFDQARALTDQAEALGPDPGLAAEITYLRGCVELYTGHSATAAAQMRAAAGAAARHAPGRALGMLAGAMQALGGTGDLSGMADLLMVAEDLPGPGGGPDVLDMMRGLAWLHRGDLDAGYTQLESFVRRSGQSDDPRQLTRAAAAAVYLGDEAAARHLYTRAAARARQTGALGILPMILGALAMAEAHSGQIALAESDADEGRQLAAELGQPHWLPLNLAALVRVAAVRGREQHCQTLADQVIQTAAPRGLAPPIGMAISARAELDLAVNRPEEAQQRLAGYAAGEHGVAAPIIVLGIVPDQVEAAIRAGLPPPAAALARFEAFAAHARAPWAPPLARRCQALLAAGPDAGPLFGQALDLHAGTQRPLDLARTQLLYGEHLRRRKARGAAVAQLRAALASFQQLGACPWAARAETELRACGHPPAGRRDDLFDQLTPQQLQIVRLVSDGLTNRQVAAQMFLSPRTVEYHLAQVYPKLQITSRTDLVRAYTRRGSSPVAAGDATPSSGHQ